jgi:hypothetical protein
MILSLLTTLYLNAAQSAFFVAPSGFMLRNRLSRGAVDDGHSRTGPAHGVAMPELKRGGNQNGILMSG